MAAPNIAIELVLKAGVETSLSAKDFPQEMLTRFVSVATQAGTTLIIRDASALSPVIRNGLATQAPKNVRFEL